MGELTLLALVFGGGLIVGWNFLPQPKWIAKFFR